MLDQDLQLERALKDIARKDARIRELETGLSAAARRQEEEAGQHRRALAARDAEIQRLQCETDALRVELAQARALVADFEETYHQGVEAAGIDLLGDGADAWALQSNEEGLRIDEEKEERARKQESRSRRHQPLMSPSSKSRSVASIDLADSLLKSIVDPSSSRIGVMQAAARRSEPESQLSLVVSQHNHGRHRSSADQPSGSGRRDDQRANAWDLSEASGPVRHNHRNHAAPAFSSSAGEDAHELGGDRHFQSSRRVTRAGASERADEHRPRTSDASSLYEREAVASLAATAVGTPLSRLPATKTPPASRGRGWVEREDSPIAARGAAAGFRDGGEGEEEGSNSPSTPPPRRLFQKGATSAAAALSRPSISSTKSASWREAEGEPEDLASASPSVSPVPSPRAQDPDAALIAFQPEAEAETPDRKWSSSASSSLRQLHRDKSGGSYKHADQTQGGHAPPLSSSTTGTATTTTTTTASASLSSVSSIFRFGFPTNAATVVPI